MVCHSTDLPGRPDFRFLRCISVQGACKRKTLNLHLWGCSTGCRLPHVSGVSRVCCRRSSSPRQIIVPTSTRACGGRHRRGRPAPQARRNRRSMAAPTIDQTSRSPVYAGRGCGDAAALLQGDTGVAAGQSRSGRSGVFHRCHASRLHRAPRYSWVCKGETRALKSKHGRVRVNTSGALSRPDHQVVHRTAEKITSATMIAVRGPSSAPINRNGVWFIGVFRGLLDASFWDVP
jgi:hypothetical protein